GYGYCPDQSRSCLAGVAGLALDSARHELFVADRNFDGPNRVMVFDTSQLSNGMDASYELGERDFTSTDSAADNYENDQYSDTGYTPNARSFAPTGLAYDRVRQRLFVEDVDAARVLVFDVANGRNDMRAAGVIGQPNLHTSPLSLYDDGDGDDC